MSAPTPQRSARVWLLSRICNLYPQHRIILVYVVKPKETNEPVFLERLLAG